MSEAITLGWRIATLYSLRAGELPGSPPDNLLPMRRSLPAAERLALELRAAEGDADRLGMGLEPAALEELVGLAGQAGESDAAEEAFAIASETWRVELKTRLWADHEATGKAYELGSFIADTSNRVVLGMRRTDEPDGYVTRELREAVVDRSVERVKRLLDDLQARIEPAAVRIVKQHLERWHEAVGARGPVHHARRARAARQPGRHLVSARVGRQGARGLHRPRGARQACAAPCARARWAPTPATGAASSRATVAVVVLADRRRSRCLSPRLREPGTLVAFAGSMAGALGVSLASVGRTVRKSLDARAELL